jgi:hypothetical protein
MIKPICGFMVFSEGHGIKSADQAYRDSLNIDHDLQRMVFQNVSTKSSKIGLLTHNH